VKRALAAAVAVAAVAHAEGRPGYGGAAAGPLGSSVNAIDPAKAARPGELELVSLLFDTPFALDGAGHPRPRLATEIQQVDPLHARLVVRPALRFDDGRPLTAADVAASLERARDPRLAASWSLAPIRSARAISDEVVEIELLRPTPELATLLSFPVAAVTPGGQAPSPRVAGAGPFRLVRFDARQIVLAANPLCPEGRPYLDELVLRFFGSRAEEAGSYEVGKTQVSLHGATAFEGGAPKHKSVALDGPRALTMLLAFGRGFADAGGARPPPGGPRGGLPDDPSLRRAIASVIDRERLRRLTVRDPSQPALGLVPSSSGLKPPLDPPRARAELARFAQAAPNGRLRASLLLDQSRFDDRDVADLLLSSLADAGLDLTIDAVDARTYGDRLDRGIYDLALVEAGGLPGDNAGLSALAALAAVDARRARALLDKAPADLAAVERAVAEKAIATPLYHRSPRAHHRADLAGLALDGNGRVDYAAAHWIK